MWAEGSIDKFWKLKMQEGPKETFNVTEAGTAKFRSIALKSTVTLVD